MKVWAFRDTLILQTRLIFQPHSPFLLQISSLFNSDSEQNTKAVRKITELLK
jgi:hypothetical protein